MGRRKKKPEPVTVKEAKACRPLELPDVEPELRAPSPRPWVWDMDEAKAGEELEELLRSGEAATAWIVRNESYWEGGCEMGPVYDIHYAFDINGTIHLGRFTAAYDGLHLAYGAPEYTKWLAAAFVDRKDFTVLFPPGRPEKSRIYGCFELFVRNNGDRRWAAR